MYVKEMASRSRDSKLAFLWEDLRNLNSKLYMTKEGRYTVGKADILSTAEAEDSIIEPKPV